MIRTIYIFLRPTGFRYILIVLSEQVRYFDPVNRRPGLPSGVAALVDALSAESVGLHLINTDSQHLRKLIVQAGAFREHTFTSVRIPSVSIT